MISTSEARYQIAGMDCARDAAEIEASVRAVAGVETVSVSAATHIMTLAGLEPETYLAEVEQAVTRLGYGMQHLPSAGGKFVGGSGEKPNEPARVTAAYRRALWLAVLLNVGFGLVEMVGGFLSDSQALKADALDFLGDGLITLLGLLAIGWSLRWRGRSALIQGVFLGALGVGVLISTAYRVLSQPVPEAELMGCSA